MPSPYCHAFLCLQTSYMSGYENPDGTCTIDRSRGRLLAVPSKERLTRVLQHLFDEEEFLSPHGSTSASMREIIVSMFPIALF